MENIKNEIISGNNNEMITNNLGYLIESAGNKLRVSTEDYEFLVSPVLVGALNTYTNDTNASLDLIGYFKERVASYNDDVEFAQKNAVTEEEANQYKKFVCPESFIRVLFTMLLSCNIDETLIIDALEGMGDNFLFGDCNTNNSDEVNKRILKIYDAIRESILPEYSYTDSDEDSFVYTKRPIYE